MRTLSEYMHCLNLAKTRAVLDFDKDYCFTREALLACVIILCIHRNIERVRMLIVWAGLVFLTRMN